MSENIQWDQPSSNKETIQWDKPLSTEETIQQAIPTAEEEYQGRVEKYQPWATEMAKASGPGAASSGNIKNLPIVGPLFEKGLAYGAAATGIPIVEGDTTEERYRNILAKNEAADRALKEAFPTASKIGSAMDLAASVATTPELGVEAAIAKSAPALKSVAPFLGKTIEGAGYGAASAATEGPPGETLDEKIKRIGPQAAIGAAAPHVVQGILGSGAWALGGAKNLVSDIFNPAGAEIRTLAEEANKISGKESVAGLTPQEYADAVNRGEDVSLLDLQGAKGRVAHAAERLPENTNISKINENLDQRFKESSARLGSDIDTAFGKPIDAAAIRDQAVKEARLNNKPLYDNAYNTPIDYASSEGRAIENIINNRVPSAALKRANEIMRLEGKQSNQILANIADDGSVTFQRMPDTMQVDYITRALNDMAKSGEGAGAMGGQTQLGSAYQSLARDLRDNLKMAVPEYGAAVDGAGRYIKQNNAFDAGVDFFNLANVGTKTSDPKLIGQQLNNFKNVYSDVEKETMAQGLASYIKENPYEAAKVFAKGDKVTMDRFKTVLGADRFNQIDDALRINRLAAMTKEIGNASQTKNLFGPIVAGGIGAAAITAIQNSPQIFEHVKDNPVAAGGVLAFLALAGAGKAGISAQGNRRAASLLALAASDNPEISQKILAASQKDARVREALKNLEGQVARTYSAINAQNTEPQSLNLQEREGRKSGGRIGVLTPQALLSDLKRRKIKLANKTEHMLSLPDDAVVQALDAAKR